MDPSNLRATLSELHESLQQVTHVDAETKGLLHGLAADLQRLLEEPSTNASALNLRGRLQEFVLQQETEHPQLTGILARIADGLSSLGI